MYLYVCSLFLLPHRFAFAITFLAVHGRASAVPSSSNKRCPFDLSHCLSFDMYLSCWCVGRRRSSWRSCPSACTSSPRQTPACRDARKEGWRCTNFGRTQKNGCADNGDTGRLQTVNKEQAVKHEARFCFLIFICFLVGWTGLARVEKRKCFFGGKQPIVSAPGNKGSHWAKKRGKQYVPGFRRSFLLPEPTWM